MRDVPFEELCEQVAGLLRAYGYGASSARVLAHTCVSAQRDGHSSHGLFRLKDYRAAIATGYVNGDPSPRVEDAAPGLLRVDADNGFAQVALEGVREVLVERARANGVAILAIRDSHHLGALYLDVEDLADRGLVALALVNSSPAVAPAGGRRVVFGTDPVAFAAPRESGPPLVIDQSSSTMSHGDLQLAAAEGRALPQDTGIDRDGRPTGDPDAILDGGALSPFGGHKGGSIALIVEVLCAALVGADFSFEVSARRPAGAPTARTGETIVVIDPSVGAGGLPGLPERLDVLLDAVTAAGQPRLPGTRRLASRRADGLVRLSEQEWSQLQELVAEG